MSPPSGCFFGGGGERLKKLYSRRVFLHSDFFTFFYYYTFSLFYIFYIFRFFHFFYIFTFLQFFRGHSSRCFFFRAGKPESGFGVVGLKAKPTFISLNPLAHFSFLQFFRGHSGRCFLCGEKLKKNFMGVGQSSPNPILLPCHHAKKTRSRGYKTLFLLNSAEHKIYPAHKC